MKGDQSALHTVKLSIVYQVCFILQPFVNAKLVMSITPLAWPHLKLVAHVAAVVKTPISWVRHQAWGQM